MCGCEICVSAPMRKCELNKCIPRHIEKLISYSERSHYIIYGQKTRND